MKPTVMIRIACLFTHSFVGVCVSSGGYCSSVEDARYPLSYEQAILLAQKNHFDIQLFSIEQKEEIIKIEKQTNNKAQTSIIELQEKLMQANIEVKIKNKLDELKKQIIDFYDKVYLANKKVELSKLALKYAQDAYKTAEKSLQRGLMDANQLNDVKEHVQLAQQELIEAEHGCAQATSVLLLTCNLPLNTVVELTDTIKLSTHPLDLDRAKLELEKHNRTIQLVSMQVQLNQVLVESSAKNALQSASDLVVIKLSYEKSDILLKKVKTEINNGLTILYLSALTKKEAAQTAQIQYKFAIHEYETCKEKLERGLVKETDVQIAHLKRIGMELNLLSKIAEYNINVLAFEQLYSSDVSY